MFLKKLSIICSASRSGAGVRGWIAIPGVLVVVAGDVTGGGLAVDEGRLVVEGRSSSPMGRKTGGWWPCLGIRSRVGCWLSIDNRAALLPVADSVLICDCGRHAMSNSSVSICYYFLGVISRRRIWKTCLAGLSRPYDVSFAYAHMHQFYKGRDSGFHAVIYVPKLKFDFGFWCSVKLAVRVIGSFRGLWNDCPDWSYIFSTVVKHLAFWVRHTQS